MPDLMCWPNHESEYDPIASVLFETLNELTVIFVELFQWAKDSDNAVLSTPENPLNLYFTVLEGDLLDR